MESFENKNIGSEKIQREQILSTALIVELFKQDNDFEEYTSLNSLSKKLESLLEDQFNLCKRFIEREYNKINISKEQRGDYVDHYYLRNFLSHDILSRFKKKLTLVLQFLLKYENIDLCTEYFYKYEKKVIENLEKMSETQISSILLLSEEVINNLINIMKSRPEITAFLIENIDIFTNEQITQLEEIDKICHNYSNKYSNVCIDIFGLLYLKHPINIDIETIFESIKPQFLYDTYNEFDETDVEEVNAAYYRIQLRKMQNDYLNQKINKEEFIQYLKGDYIQEKVFRSGGVWQGR